MSQETFQIIQSMDFINLELQVALQCTPLLTGLKISNLLIVQKDNAQIVQEMFQGTQITCLILYTEDVKTTFLLYREKQLTEYIETDEVQRLLGRLGYRRCSLRKLLVNVQSRYERYRNNGMQFPHEMGLLLGYPVEDVTGFIINKGKNFLHTGYWKVYENLAEKLELFERFNKEQEVVIRLISCGESILDIVNNYNKQLAVKSAV